MPRIARVVAVGLPHHITQRGNYQQKVFLDEADNRRYLHWIEEYSIKFGLSILVHSLMPNHIHLIGIPSEKHSLSKTLNAAHMRYSQYFNEKMKRQGHLWQGRFYSCILDMAHFLLAARYIERNPVRAGLVEKPWHWPWSSASSHIGEKGGDLIGLGDFLGLVGMSCDQWKKFIDCEEDSQVLQRIRKYTLTGRPLGESVFLKEMEDKLGRKLSVTRAGRPRIVKK
jgi:putative transposase